MEKTICNAPWGKAKTSRFARVVVLALAAALGAVTALGDGLPTGYTQVPLIQANGNCQIRTGIVPSSTDKVELSWRPCTVSGNQGLWCSRDSSAKNTFTAFMIANQVRLDRNASSVTCTGALLAGTNYTVVADYATLVGVVTNDISHTELTRGTMPSGDYTPTAELCLFASHQGTPTTSYGNAGSWACYSFKLRDSAGNLKLDLVPAKRDEDGVFGLYDLARSTFLTNSQSGFFTTSGMTITPSDPEWGKALTVTSDTVIDAGEGATWSGALTVYGGATLTTRGNLTVSGTTTVNAGSTLDIETGTASFTFGSKAMSGALYIRQGAQLNMNRSDACFYHAGFAVHVYGTFNAQNSRTSVGVEDKIYFHDGARIIGAGDGNGAFDFFDNGCRLFVDGNVTCESPLRARVANYNLNVICSDNAHINFAGGFGGNSAGTVVQVAATTEQGNASGTCTNAFIEVGANPSMTGKFVFISPAAISLKGETQTFTVETSAAELEVRARGDVARANHVLVQKLPTITTSTATVRLVGDGVCAFLDAAPTFPVVFAGASLAIATNAPVALAAGSSVISNTVIGVEGLEAETAATLLTGVDSSFDVSKVSAQAMFNGVLLGTPAAVSFDGAGAVVTAGVAAYDATAWIELFIETKALVWLDASDAANFEFKDNTFGYVTTWKDRSAYKRDATAYTVPSHDSNWGTLSVTNGVPAYCMGACDSGIDLKYTRMTTMRTIFWAMSICRNSQAFFLGDNSSYHFHRGGSGQYCYNNNNAIWKNGKIYCDGVEVTDKFNTYVPTDRHVYSTVTAANCASDRLTCDRNSGTYIRHGGRELSELIAFDTALSDSDRQAIEAYLAAKWMGTNPTAAGTEGTYAVTGDLAVDDHVGGDKNLSFSEGASVTVVNPSSTGAMVATTGAVTIPAGSPLAVNVDASALTPGTYTVMQAGSGITDISQFTPTATVGAGASATFAVVDGKLTMTISVTASVSSQTWRPDSSADLGWNTTSPNWLYDGGTTGGFIPYVPAFIDGAETATGDITVTGTQTAGPITLTGANDYTFKGDGTLAGGDTVTLGGTGTVTLDGANLGGQDVVITNGQKVVLGFNAGPNSLGTDSGSTGGKVTIAEGSQLNANDISLSATDARSEITQLKTFSIAGDGPDGRGAIVNDALDGRSSHSSQNCALRRIELSGDASIGGTDRVDLRARSGTAATATPGIYGPGKTLTVKNSVWFAIWSQPIDVQSILIPAGGMFLPVQMAEAHFNIPGGITLDGGLIDHYQNAYPASVPFHVTANGGTFQSGGGASTVKGNVSVASGATLALTGDQNVTYSGAFNANGAAVTHSNSAATYFTGTSEGNLDITQTAGTVYLQNKVGGTVTVTKSAGSAYIGSGFSNSTVNVVQTGGSSGFYTQTAAPIFDSANFNITSGTFDIRPQAAGILDVGGTVNIDQADAGTTYVYSTTNNNEFGVAMKMVGTVGSLRVGLNNGRAGTLQLKEGSDVSVKFLSAGDGGAGPSRGRIVIDSDAKVTIRSGGDVRVGHWHTAPSSVQTQTLDIAGELDCSIGTLYTPMDAPRAETYLREGGVLKAKGLMANRSGRGTTAPSATHTFNYGNGTGAAEGRHWFMMEGGRLEIGTGGILGVCIPGVTKFDFQNGDIVNVGAWGSDYGLPMFFGYDAVGGELTFDLGGSLVNWNTGLSGASDVTLKGSANFQGNRYIDRMQGAMIGKLTVENTGANDLRTTSAFAGGLTLAPGVSAQVAKYGETNYAYAVSVNSAAMIDYVAGSGWSYPYVSADFFGFAYTKFSTSLLPKTAVSAGRGEFYVPADKAGVWTFAGNYDDNIALYVDGTQVFKTTSWSQVGRGTNTLAAGWHKFTIAVYDGGQPGGPSSDGWGNGKGLGFHVGEITATAASNYIKFADGEDFGDGTKLQVRPSPNVAVWSFCDAAWNATTWPTREDWTHIKCIDALTVMYKNSKASDANTWKQYIFGKTSKFEGWFRVEDDKAGTWTFKAAYDDRSLLKIDGVQVCRSDAWNSVATGTAELSAGWHRWEVRVGEGAGGGWGPDNTVNGGNTVSYIAPGDTEKRFDENNLKLAATLGDVALIEPNGIHKDLELGAGATLTSNGTLPMSIYGTLKGTGSLAGSWEFAGDHNCWEVTNAVAKTAELPVATFAAATPATFAGLKSVRVRFDAKPTRKAYYLTGVIDGLTAADLPVATMTVKDADDRDYSANFTLMVKNGRLAIGNSKPAGITILIR